LFNASEFSGVLNSLQHPPAVLDVGIVVFDPAVEDVRQAVLSHERIGQDSYAFEDGVIEVLEPPHQLQVVD